MRRELDIVRALFFIFGSGVGASSRFLINRYFLRNLSFSWDILLVNTVGSFLLGLIIENDSDVAVGWFGVCGALTTWSAFALDLDKARRERKLLQLFINIAGNFILGVGALLLARTIAG